MSSSHRKRRNVRLLLTARGVRAFGDGFVSILVPVYLTGIGFGAFEVGALTTAMLLGPAMMTLGIGLIAHRLKTVRLLATATTLMVLSGIGYAFETEFWPLLIIALVGTLSPTASDVSVFAPLEQSLLSDAVVPRRRTSIFATYSLIGSVLSAVGCLFASAPEIVARTVQISPNRALQGMFLVYAFLAAIAFMIYRQLKSPAEAPVSEPAGGPLGPSRRVVFTLAACSVSTRLEVAFSSSHCSRCGCLSISGCRLPRPAPCSSGPASSQLFHIQSPSGWLAELAS